MDKCNLHKLSRPIGAAQQLVSQLGCSVPTFVRLQVQSQPRRKVSFKQRVNTGAPFNGRVVQQYGIHVVACH